MDPGVNDFLSMPSETNSVCKENAVAVNEKDWEESTTVEKPAHLAD